jgi:hypothetical protein
MDDSTGIYAAIRGHGLARLVYGWNYTVQPGGQVVGRDASGNPLNIIPFNGVGYDKDAVDYNQINFTVFPGDTTARHPRTDWHDRPGDPAYLGILWLQRPVHLPRPQQPVPGGHRL